MTTLLTLAAILFVVYGATAAAFYYGFHRKMSL